MTKPSDYQTGVSIHLGQQTRTLRFGHQALLVGGQLLKKMGFNGNVREAMAYERDVAVVCAIASAGFLHEDKATSPTKVARWLDAEPAKYRELEAKLTEAVRIAYEAMGVLERAEDGAPGEGGSSTTASTNGATPSASLPASASGGDASGF